MQGIELQPLAIANAELVKAKVTKVPPKIPTS